MKERFGNVRESEPQEKKKRKPYTRRDFSNINRPEDVFKRINMHEGDKDVCWEWTGALRNHGVRDDSRPKMSIAGRQVFCYRIVYELYTGNTIKDRERIRHTCDNKICCNPFHLITGSQADNVQDMLIRERVGMKHYHVRKIMEWLEMGLPSKYIAAKLQKRFDLDLHDATIRHIRLRKMYKHIEWPWGDAYVAKVNKRRAALRRMHALAGDSTSDTIDTSSREGESNG